jgi:oligopeptide/dipeptide ABC transporter ATP-binding protein
MPLLDIRNLTLDFLATGGAVRVVDGLSLSVAVGETVCLVGESGSGKSVTALSVARLLATPSARYAAGEIWLAGRDVLRLNSRELRAVRGGVVSYVFQEPGASLNPVVPVGRQIREALALHRPERATSEEVLRLLRAVHIPAPESRARDYPFQMSGGMQQRVMLAMALASEPQLLIADEPTTALDVTIQAQILDLLAELQQRLGMAILLITHNLGLVGRLGDRVAVMYAGQIVEMAPAPDLLRRPRHPYTQALLNSVPRLRGGAERLTAIPGTVPVPGAWPAGCRFAPRCPMVQPTCHVEPPALAPTAGAWQVRCPYAAPPE